MAARRSRAGRRTRRSRSCSAAHTLVGPGPAAGPRPALSAAAASPTTRGPPARLSPRAAARPRRRRRGRGARRRDPSGDRARGGPITVRPVHGARALRAGARLLPPARRRARARGRRLPDRARGPSDLRRGARPAARGDLGRLGPAGAVHDPRDGAGERGAGRGPARRAAGPRARRCSGDPLPRSRSRQRGSRRPGSARGRRPRRPRSPTAPGRPVAGVVVANEVLDAFPVHRVVGRAGRLRELLVGWARRRLRGGRGDPSTPALAARLANEGVALAEGQARRSGSRIDAWLAGVDRRPRPRGRPAHRLRRGRGPVRPGAGAGTLLGFAGQRVGGDPFRTSAARTSPRTSTSPRSRAAAARAGLEPSAGRPRRSSCRRRRRATSSTRPSGPGATLEDALALRSALARLLDPRGRAASGCSSSAAASPPGTPLPGLLPLAPRRALAPAFAAGTRDSPHRCSNRPLVHRSRATQAPSNATRAPSGPYRAG